ncbi:DUF2800 domain-containing protein [Pseudogracilibacillus auburnensis]|uniref:DUF2800 domain-containing protein n=1 Tax=Pseudogracilibacillus auburnensis TaxID=1494959 RepID=UPI001A96674D|nr:DUF2800 domain-containing protein [Pseudogracilibacillus auburnensis]MBO1001286.1 DUF2800 domain-containing protein [Pseudogracilibacillus auburnensis]
MTKHAILSASGAHRWMNCTPSARLELEFEDSSGEAAKEGTAAHELGEHKLRDALKIPTKKPTSIYDSEEVERYTDEYVQFILEELALVKQKTKDPLPLIEQRLDFSNYVPEGFGTGDCVIVADDVVHVIDFKYGQGVLVEAGNNSQMMLYALGALNLFDSIYGIDSVKMTIYQPRRENISTFEILKTDLLDWAENTLKPKSDLAFEGSGEFKSGEWCRFCRASVQCRARAEENLKVAQFEFKKPPLLTDGEIAEILLHVNNLTKWANEIFAYATNAAVQQGKEWEGFKVVEGRSNRKYTDEKAVAEAAKKAGYEDIYKQSLLTITNMEKLMGKKKFNEILADFIIKTKGKPTLVPLTDKRPEINISTAKNEFMEEK